MYFLRHQTFKEDVHRFGWNAVLEKLIQEFHNEDSTIAVDDFMEFTFFGDKNKYKDALPYTFPWYGFVHHPCNVTFPFDVKYGAPALFTQQNLLDSLKECKGIFTLSNRLKEDVKVLLDKTEYANLRIESLIYPTNLNQPQFNINSFLLQPKVICLGWWLRKFESLFKLKTQYPKFFLLGNSEWAKGQFNLCMKLYKEKRTLKLNLPDVDGTVLPFLNGQQYDKILTESIVFLDLIDTSANTSIIECIATSTPVLVNPLPAVVEYLGVEYPFYYDSFEEASAKINDINLIAQTHAYLRDMDKTKFSYEHFIQQFRKYIEDKK